MFAEVSPGLHSVFNVANIVFHYRTVKAGREALGFLGYFADFEKSARVPYRGNLMLEEPNWK